MTPKLLLTGLLVVLAAVFFGCTYIPSTNAQSFELGKEFTIVKGITYTNQGIGMILEANEFTYSPYGAEAGRINPGPSLDIMPVEQGVRLRLEIRGFPEDLTNSQELFLTEGNPRVAFKQFTIELVSITNDSAVIKVSETGVTTPIEEKAWFSIEPRQCGDNAWNQWDLETGWSQTVRFSSADAMEKALIRAWLQSEGITVYDVATRTTSEIVCMACSCPSGREVAVLVDQKDFDKMSGFNWNQLPPSACTQELKICPNGLGVSRMAPWCEFPPCQDVEVIPPTDPPADANDGWFWITKDVKGTNAWDKEVTEKRLWRTDEELIRFWLENYHDVEVIAFSESYFADMRGSGFYAGVNDNEDVSGTNGLIARPAPYWHVAVKVGKDDFETIQKLNFTYLPGPFSVTLDAKICPGGETVGRTEPYNEWAPCPAFTPNFSTATIGMDLEYVPGFVLIGQSKKIHLDSNGMVTTTIQDINRASTEDPKTTVKTTMITRAQLEEIAQFAWGTNFFSLTEDDARMCIADGPTQHLSITVDATSNTVNNIGAECDPAKLEQTRQIIEMIENLLEEN